jgi:hypothetical protein
MIIRTSLRTRAIRLKSLIRRPLLTLYALQGRVGGSHFNTLVADDGTALDYFRCLIYGEQCSVSRKGVIPTLGACRLSCSSADLVVVAANRMLTEPYRRAGFYIVPRQVDLRLPVTGTPEDVISGLPPSAREDIRRNLRRAQANGYTCEVTRDEAWFDTFYHRMYVPFAAQRHGCQAMVYPYRRVKELFLLGAGMMIRRNAEPVGGALFCVEDTTFETPFLGIMNGDVALSRDGVCLALYYNAIRLAHELGCSSIDFGYSRPFLSDGALRYKLKWGMVPRDTKVHVGVFAMIAPGPTEAALRFLEANRFFEIVDDGIRLAP